MKKFLQNFSHLLLAAGDGGEDVVLGVVDAHLERRETLSVGRPKYHHLVQVVLLLEFADVLADLVYSVVVVAAVVIMPIRFWSPRFRSDLFPIRIRFRSEFCFDLQPNSVRSDS